ncbi:MAG: toxic anion resistance protein [Erysipelotrichaceae bacterium]|nr:toxic anion resistance protein [Erysipelotrichaceae bacterium]MBR2791596.1 toxic anion resistance protein [Erysipelotrichaceae bacterium]MBR3352831.1 toxic anion resistance protein [Erysipelotrichaceae bacterium]MBR6956885.1 toxic anion resistance protein [Erysipelotrichaceae bacterium]
MSYTMEEEKIVLTLDPNADQPKAQAIAEEEVKEEVIPAPLDSSSLSAEEAKMVEEFAEKIDITQTDTVMQYGASAQKKISQFSDSTLKNIKTKDLGEIGNMISDLVVELKGFDIDEKDDKGFFSLFNIFKKAGNSFTALKSRYDAAEVNVTKVANILEDHQIQLLKDITVLDELYERNTQNKKELTMYILAGQKKLKHAQEVELPALVAKAKETGTEEDAQAANDYANLINRFEKKLHDLELTRMISLQMAPQIRLIQNNDTLMAEKIQSTLTNTIPLWKSQMVIALGLQHSQDAIDAEAAVDKVTNELLRKNAEKLKQSTIETAKASERAIVEVETLKFTNQSLIDTLDEVLKIQDEGRAKRAAAEVEIRKLEEELRNKLLEVRKN